MNLDASLQPLALKHKDFVVLDFSFPATMVPGFARAQEHRFLHLPMRYDSAVLVAEGWALAGWTVLVLGVPGLFEPRDSTLPIRRILSSSQGDEFALEASFSEFGYRDILLPLSDFDKLSLNSFIHDSAS